MEQETGIKWLDGGDRCEIVTDAAPVADKLRQLAASYPDEVRQEPQEGGAVRYSFPARLIGRVRRIAVTVS